MPGQNTGEATELNAHSATAAFEGLLSEDPEYSEAEDEEKEPAPSDTPESETEEGAEPESAAEEPAEGEGDPEESDTPSEESEEPELITVRLPDGTEEKVPVEELAKGYLRTSDYTRKTQAVAEERKAVAAEKEKVLGLAQQYDSYLTQLKTALESSVPKEPDWDKLREENPDEFAATWADWQRHQQRLAAVEKEQETTRQQIAQAQMERFRTHLETEKGKLLEVLPAWKDATVAKKEQGEIREFANALGFTDDEVNQVTDHRLIVLLRKAMLQDRAEKAKPVVQKKVEQRTTVVKPGTGKKGKPMPESTKAYLRLRKTGSDRDAVKAMEQFID